MPHAIWLDRDKETDNKVRWSVEVDGVPFSLYVPKWRVPEPWPARIRVGIRPDTAEVLPSTSRDAVTVAPEARRRPIEVRVARVEDKTETIRYAPVEHGSDAEIGEPYIPKSFTEDGEERLVVSVTWA